MSWLALGCRDYSSPYTLPLPPGCRDYSSILALSTTLKMWDRMGVKKVHAYMRNTLAKAVALLTKAWGTGTLVPLSLCGSMVRP